MSVIGNERIAWFSAGVSSFVAAKADGWCRRWSKMTLLYSRACCKFIGRPQPRLRVVLDQGAHLPDRAHGTDAGADLRCIEGFTVLAHGSAVIDTGVHVELPPCTKGELKSKSGLSVTHCITTPGLIAEGFDQKQAVLLMYSVSGIMGTVAVLYSRGLYVECIGLLAVVAMIIGVILTDTGKNNISLKGRRILREDLGDENQKKRKKRRNTE